MTGTAKRCSTRLRNIWKNSDKMVDNELLNKGVLRLHWAEMHTPVLQLIRERFKKEKPLKGL